MAKILIYTLLINIIISSSVSASDIPMLPIKTKPKEQPVQNSSNIPLNNQPYNYYIINNYYYSNNLTPRELREYVKAQKEAKRKAKQKALEERE